MDIYIRDINAEIKTKLEEQAKSKGISLNVYVKAILEDYAMHPQLRSIEDKYTHLVELVMTGMQNELDKTTEIIEANNYLMEKIKDKIKGE